MKKKLREKVKERFTSIELKISHFFADRLGVDDIRTIDALNLTFIEKINTFCEMVVLSKIERAKLNVFTKIYKEIVLQNKLMTYDDYFSTTKSYMPFLFNIYLENNVVFSIEEKFSFVVEQLVKDVDLLTTYHIEKPQIYYNDNVGIILPE